MKSTKNRFKKLAGLLTESIDVRKLKTSDFKKTKWKYDEMETSQLDSATNCAYYYGDVNGESINMYIYDTENGNWHVGYSDDEANHEVTKHFPNQKAAESFVKSTFGISKIFH